jgi:rhamnogalacturonan hydrolase
MRLVQVTSFSVHDVALVDCEYTSLGRVYQVLSPLLHIAGAFHLILDNVMNGEVYNVIIRGGNRGGLDGIDVWGTNVWIHDVEVTNKDECVTIKV